MHTSTTPKEGGTGCVLLFLSSFLLAGLAAIGKGIYDYTAEPRFTEEVIALLGAGSMLAIVGGGLMLLVLAGRRKEKAVEAAQARHPEAPWLWRADWAAGQSRPAAAAAMLVYWFFGLAFTGASIPVFLNLDEILRKEPIGYAAFLFPLGGIGMLIAAAYVTLRHFKFGRSWCDLITRPGVVGGWFRAVVWANVKLAPQDTVEAVLTCFHCYVTGTGKNRKSHRKVEWQERLRLSGGQLATGAKGRMAIPVRFYIPRSCTPTTPAEPTDRREWELKVTATLPGIDYAAAFIVPVFVTEESRDEPPADAERADSPLDAPSFTPSIEVFEGVSFLEFHAPPRRNWGVIWGFTLFTALWTAIIAGMLYSGVVPIFFPVVLGFIDIFFLAAVIWLWFGHARVRFEHGEVHLSRTVFGIGPRTTVALADVFRADAHITMQSGDTPYYTIRLQTASGTKNTVGGIREKAEANNIVERIDALVGS